MCKTKQQRVYKKNKSIITTIKKGIQKIDLHTTSTDVLPLDTKAMWDVHYFGKS